MNRAPSGLTCRQPFGLEFFLNDIGKPGEVAVPNPKAIDRNAADQLPQEAESRQAPRRVAVQRQHMWEKPPRACGLPHGLEIHSLPAVQNEDPGKRLGAAPYPANMHPGRPILGRDLQRLSHLSQHTTLDRKRHQRWAGVRQNLSVGATQDEHIVGEQGMAAPHQLGGKGGLPAAGGGDEGDDSLRRGYSARVKCLEASNQADTVKNGVEEKALPLDALPLHRGTEQRPPLPVKVKARLAPVGEQVVARLAPLTADVAVVGEHRLPCGRPVRVTPLTGHLAFLDEPETHVRLVGDLRRARDGQVKGRSHPQTVGAIGSVFHVTWNAPTASVLAKPRATQATRKNLPLLKVHGTMDTGYVAFGLALRCAFPLPGMAPREAEGLPSLALELVTPGELRAAWSERRSPPWRGRLGDGREFTIERGTGGDLLFTYGDRARFRLDAARSRLECAPRDAAELDWQRVLLSRILPNVSLAHGREALHASAVESPLGVIAIAAPSEMGKSTLAGELVRRGWPLFTDDVLVLATAAGGAEAHPGTPHMNVAQSQAAGPEGRGTTLGVLAGERWVSIPDAAREPSKVATVFLFERGPGLTLTAQPLPPSPLTLAPYMLGLPDDGERESQRFALYSDLIDSATIVRLTGGMKDKPTALADTIEGALDLNAHLATRGAA